MITLEYRNSSDNWEEYKTFENQEDLRQDINSFLYDFKEFEEIYIYYWINEEEKKSRSKVLLNITPKKINFSEFKKSLQNKEVLITIFYPNKTKEIKANKFMIYKDYKAKILCTNRFMFDWDAEFFKDDEEQFKAVCKNYRVQFNIKRNDKEILKNE
jgi:hypothetical protein